MERKQFKRNVRRHATNVTMRNLNVKIKARTRNIAKRIKIIVKRTRFRSCARRLVIFAE